MVHGLGKGLHRGRGLSGSRHATSFPQSHTRRARTFSITLLPTTGSCTDVKLDLPLGAGSLVGGEMKMDTNPSTSPRARERRSVLRASTA